MVPLGIALWRHVMRYNPANAAWFDRDRFVLSNGHAAIFQYIMLHVAGYAAMSMAELRKYASGKAVDADGSWDKTICHGHPEIEVPGIEVSTGPLGQGIANAVGLAIASRNLAGTFNREGYEVIQSRVYCVTGDGCLMEGVALEAIAIAGHLKLDNLVLCYDNNEVTCDGPLDWISSDDTNAKMRASGWHVIDVFTGDTSVSDIISALNLARSTKGKPTFINIRTTIGYGTAGAGTHKTHHSTYSDADAAHYSSSSSSSTHRIPEDTVAYFAHCKSHGEALERDWIERLDLYCKAFPENGQRLRERIAGNNAQLLEKTLRAFTLSPDCGATREHNGRVFSHVLDACPSVLAGSCDLWNSGQLGDTAHRIFDANNPAGQIIRYGIREHAMASIANGLAAYSPGTFIPITSTFFMFYLYAAAGVRMGALSELRVIHIALHDSIGEGQNGPTHQPVELDSLYRAMPNLLYIRPADGEEVVGAWLLAAAMGRTPTIISLARDKPETIVPNTSRDKVARGGYVVVEPAPTTTSSSSSSSAIVTLVSCGSELQFAVAAAARLTTEHLIPTRVVSMPCISVFEAQDQAYQDAVLSETPHVISVEAYVSTIWARFCTASVAMDSFGYSGSGRENFRRFRLDTDGVVDRVLRHLAGDSVRRWKLLK
ncbi:Transketolase, thiamine diphosphate binding domain-containing protein [Aspergillus insuetus]